MSNIGAIILACGNGERLQPLTYYYHKSLLPIDNGHPNIIRTIRLLNDHISGPIIVITSQDDASEFSRLLKIYNNVTIISNSKGRNKLYNNSYSLSLVNYNKHTDADGFYIIDGDNYIKDSRVFNTHIECSSFFVTEKRKNEWKTNTDSLGRIISVSKNSDGYCMSGVSYWKYDDFELLLNLLSNNTDHSLYWEDVFINNICKFNVYNYKFAKYSYEYDSISDLINNRLLTYNQIASLLSVSDKSKKLNSMTNKSYLISIDNFKKVVLRLPGKGTDKFINRNQEEIITEVMSYKGYTPETKFFDNGKIKITDYLDGYHTFDPSDSVEKVSLLLNNIHNEYDYRFNNFRIDLVKEIHTYESMYTKSIKKSIPNIYYTIRNKIMSYLEIYQHADLKLVHRDLVPDNIMVNSFNNDYKMIDWEYSGLLNSNWDYGCLASELELSFNTSRIDTIDRIVSSINYNINNICLLYKWSAIVDFVWSAWGYAKTSAGDDNLSYANSRLSKSVKYFD